MEIEKCPNPECMDECFVNSDRIDNFWIECCDTCGYSGPCADNKGIAIRLHNAISRRVWWPKIVWNVQQHDRYAFSFHESLVGVFKLQVYKRTRVITMSRTEEVTEDIYSPHVNDRYNTPVAGLPNFKDYATLDEAKAAAEAAYRKATGRG